MGHASILLLLPNAALDNYYKGNKPGPPRFARSTILVISSPNFVKLTLKKFGLAIKITPTKETVPVVSRAESLFLEGCMIN